jgi:hypothetical protein
MISNVDSMNMNIPIPIPIPKNAVILLYDFKLVLFVQLK